MVDEIIKTIEKYDGKSWLRRTGKTKGKISWTIDSEIVPFPDKHKARNIELLEKICEHLGIDF